MAGETKWTPGPWVLSPSGARVRRTLHGFNICTLNEHLDRDEVAANAGLIAAAPDLYAALENSLESFTVILSRVGPMTEAGCICEASISGIRAALRRARGEEG